MDVRRFYIPAPPHGKRGESKSMKLLIIIPEEKRKLKRGLDSLKWLLSQPYQDEKSKEIYAQTLSAYEEMLKSLGGE